MEYPDKGTLKDQVQFLHRTPQKCHFSLHLVFSWCNLWFFPRWFSLQNSHDLGISRSFSGKTSSHSQLFLKPSVFPQILIFLLKSSSFPQILSFPHILSQFFFKFPLTPSVLPQFLPHTLSFSPAFPETLGFPSHPQSVFPLTPSAFPHTLGFPPVPFPSHPHLLLKSSFSSVFPPFSLSFSPLFPQFFLSFSFGPAPLPPSPTQARPEASPAQPRSLDF